ncbi:MAG TPA: NAD(P)H-binding protein [Gaiellaceae bacterium]|nr:NAD(P)H-binding protein [Gaiellaceae bacterium]
MTIDRDVLVLGGTGKTGRRVVERLTGRGVPTRVGSRAGEPAFDWERPATWAPAVRGAGAVYLSYFPDLAVPGAVDAVRELASLALDAGARRLVLISGRGEEEAERAERVVQESGAEWTVVRCSWFAQNFSEGYLLEPVLAGVLALPAGDVPEPFVDADDIADVAVAALTDDGHAGEVYELTGPTSLTFAEAVEEIARAAGRDVRYVAVPLEEYMGLAADTVPPAYLALLAYLFREVLDGRNAIPADGVRRALGREPRDFREYARRAAATGVWDAAPVRRAA